MGESQQGGQGPYGGPGGPGPYQGQPGPGPYTGSPSGPPPPPYGYPPGPYPPPGYGYPPPGYPYPGQPPVSPSDERTYSLLAHLGGLLVSWVVPLVIYLVFKDRSAFLRRHAAEALNFQLTFLIAYIAGAILIIVVVGVFVMLAAAICAIVFGIAASMAAHRGEEYRYPITIRFVR